MNSHHQESTIWWQVILAIGIGVVCALQVGKVPPVIPVLMIDPGLSMTEAGWVASLFNLAGALLGLAFGMLADRVGAVRMVVMSMTLVAAGSAIGGFSGNATLLLLSRGLEGFGFVGAVVSAPALIIRSTSPGDRSLALGSWGSYLPVGAALGMFMAPLFDGGQAWRVLWLANSGLLVVYALLVAVAFREPREKVDARPAQAIPGLQERLAAALQPIPWLFALSFFLYAGLYYAISTWIPGFLVERQLYDIETAARIGGLVVIANIFGNLISAWAMHRGVARWKLMSAAFIVIGTGGWFLFADSAPDAFRIPIAIAMILCGGLLPAACFAGVAANARSSADISALNGIVVQGANTGGLVGAPVLAVIVVFAGGWNGAWPIIPLVSAVGLAVCLIVRKKDRFRKTEP